MTKTIIYLDQNYLSNLAKAQYDDSWQHPDRHYYETLYSEIDSRVQANRVISPGSQLQDEESEQGHSVGKIVWRILRSWDLGTSFLSPPELFYAGIERAAQTYCGVVPVEGEPWEYGFDSDPHTLVDMKTRGGFQVNFGMSDEYVDHVRTLRTRVSDQYRDFKAQLKGSFKSLDDAIEVIKTQILYEGMMPLKPVVTDAPDLDELTNVLSAPGITNYKDRIAEILESCPESDKFWASETLLNEPFLDIRARLMAADIYMFPDGKVTRSLPTDFEIVASALPHVDIMTTDRYVKHLMEASGVSKRYGAPVFSAGKEDREALLDLVQTL